jgi:uncharacterized protein
MNKVVHFEIPADNMSRAKDFYKKAFDWEITDYPMPDGSTLTGVTTAEIDPATHMPKEAGAINGRMLERRVETPAPVITVRVEYIDESIAKILDLGGKIVIPKKEFPGMGFYIYMSDTEGNIIGLFQSGKQIHITPVQNLC